MHPGLAGALDYSQYRNELFEHCNVQISPLKPAENADVSAVRTGDIANYWWVFPNLMVNLYAGVMDTNLVLPLGAGALPGVFDFYFAEGTDAAFKRSERRRRGASATGRRRHLRGRAARPAQPIIFHRPVQRPPRKHRLSVSSVVGGQLVGNG